MDKVRLGAPWVCTYTWGRPGEVQSGRVRCMRSLSTLQDRGGDLPESSGRCRSPRSTGACWRSRGAGSEGCRLCRRRCPCNQSLSHPRRERWSSCLHPGRFLQTTGQGDRRTPSDPPERSHTWGNLISNRAQITFSMIPSVWAELKSSFLSDGNNRVSIYCTVTISWYLKSTVLFEILHLNAPHFTTTRGNYCLIKYNGWPFSPWIKPFRQLVGKFKNFHYFVLKWAWQTLD